MVCKIKPKPCDTCKNLFTPFQSFQKVCKKFECMIVYAKKVEQKKADKKHAKKKVEFKLNDTRKQHKLTQKAFNRMRVLQELKWFSDKGVAAECISCGGSLGNDQWCNGHFKTVGSNGALRYDEKNCYLQHNHRCNMNLSGDIEGTKTTRGYKEGLQVRFGKDTADEIINYCESNTAPYKWIGPELSEMRKGFNAEIRRLEIELNQT